MSIPQNVLDALNKVDVDVTTVNTDVTNKAATATALATAQTNDTAAAATLTTDQATLSTDEAAAFAAIQAWVGSANPPAADVKTVMGKLHASKLKLKKK